MTPRARRQARRCVIDATFFALLIVIFAALIAQAFIGRIVQ